MSTRHRIIETRIRNKQEHHRLEMIQLEFYYKLIDEINEKLEPFGRDIYHDDTPMWEHLDEGGILLQLDFFYRGKIKQEWEARGFLADFMKAFNVLLGHLRPRYRRTSGDLQGVYDGIGRVGGYRVWVTLTVPWIPENCKVETHHNHSEYKIVTCAKAAA